MMRYLSQIQPYSKHFCNSPLKSSFRVKFLLVPRYSRTTL